MKSVGEEYQKNIIQTARLLDQKLYQKIIFYPSFFTNLFCLFLNGIGWFLAFVFIKSLPSSLSNGITKGIIRSRFNGEPPNFSSSSLKNIERAKTIRETSLKSGKKVLYLALTSHPKTTPEESPLLGKLMWSATRVATSISPNSKIKILQAIDPFALDTLSFPIVSLYSGFMAEGHIAFDRQPFERNILGRFIFRKFHYSLVFFRILNSIKQGNLFCMALSGGVVHNARILYTIKEFAQRIYFLGLKKKISKRDLEMDLIKILTQEEICSVVKGALSSSEIKELQSYLMQLGLSFKTIEDSIKDLKDELILATPYRLRFFRALLNRLCRKGNLLLILPLKHNLHGGVEVGNPTLVNEYVPALIKTFVRQNLNT